MNILKTIIFSVLCSASITALKYNKYGSPSSGYKTYAELQTRATRTGFPCPGDAQISPCVCTYDETTLNIFLDCSAVATEEELRKIMNEPFPIRAFYRITAIYNHITQLTSGVFGENTFEQINFRMSYVETIDEDIFDKMTRELQDVDFYGGHLKRFSMDFSRFSKLTDITLNNNIYLGDVIVISPTATLFQIISAGIGEADEVFSIDLPKAERIGLNGNNFVAMPDLSKSKKLKDFAFDMNDLTTLRKGDLCHSHYLTDISLTWDDLITVEPGAICVAHGGEIDLYGSEITSLPEDAWGKIVRNVADGGLKLEENPIICDCNISWIFEKKLVDKFSIGTRCGDRGPRFIDIDVDLFNQNCP